MAEYIEREGIKKSINFFFDIKLKITQSPVEIKQSVLDVIDGERAADVQPAKHSKWYQDVRPITDPDGVARRCEKVFICSFCEGINEKESRYCENCGAKMEVSDNGRV